MNTNMAIDQQTYTSRRNGACESITAGVSRGDLHANVVAVDEGDVVSNASWDRPLQSTESIRPSVRGGKGGD